MTGVQTCALPICERQREREREKGEKATERSNERKRRSSDVTGNNIKMT